MNILFQSRSDLYKPRGGDTIQIEKLAEELRKLGHVVDINLELNPDLSSYDLVNIFNINHIVEFYPQYKNAKRQGKKVVISAIYHSIKEIQSWEKQNSYGFRKALNVLGITDQYYRDYIKNVYKIIFEKKIAKLMPLINQIIVGAKTQQKEVIEGADLVFVQTQNEVVDIQDELGVSDFNHRLVVNGVDINLADLDSTKIKNKFKLDRYILEVGRVEPRKNQIMVIKAFKHLRDNGLIDKNITLLFAGDKNNHHKSYFSEFQKYLDIYPWIKYVGYLPYHKVQELMSGAMMHVYPSWFETTGLLNIEALWAGTKVVTSGDRVKEYVQNYGEYCDPADINSIADAIIRAINSDIDFVQVKEYIRSNFTWEIAGKQSEKYYKEILYGDN